MRHALKSGQRWIVRGRIPEGTPLTNPDMNGSEGPAIGVPNEELPNVEPLPPSEPVPDIPPIEIPIP